MSKSNQKNRKKTHVIILALEKVTQLVALALVAAKKKQLLIVNPQHYCILMGGKGSNKIKVVNVFTFHS